MNATQQSPFSEDELGKPVTLGLLLEYTDEFLIPRLSELIDQKLEEKLEAKLSKYPDKAYLDDKLANLAARVNRTVR